MRRLPDMHRLISTCLVLSFFQQYACYIVPERTHDHPLYEEDSNTPKTGYNDSSLVPEYIENSRDSGNIDESQVPMHTDESQEPGYIKKSQKSDYTGKSQKPISANIKQRLESVDNMTQSESNHIITNQSDLRKADIVEIADNHDGIDLENADYTSEHVTKQKTEELTVQKLSINKNKLDLKGKSVNNIQAADIDKLTIKEKLTNEEERNEENNEIINIIKAICGEQYEPCTKTTYGLQIFKDSSLCKTCSCNAKTCHISKNCCPDVQANTNDTEDDSASTEVCASISDALSFKKFNEELTEHNGINDIADKEVKTNSNTFTLTKTGEDQEINNYTKATSDETEQVLVNENTHRFNLSSLFKAFLNVRNNSSEKERKEIKEQENSYNEKPVEQDHKNLQILNEEQKPFSELSMNFFPMYLVTETCPRGFHNADITAKCENKSSTILTDHIPVSDWFTMNIYRNKWCAKCHNISTVGKWRLVTDCLQLYTMDYLPSLATDFYDLTKNCTVKVIPPAGQETEHKVCQSSSVPLIPRIIDTCNVTGLWKQNIPIIEKLCNQRNYMPIYKKRMLGTETIKLYKNIFCYTCNTADSLQTLESNRQEGNDTDYTESGTRLYMDINVADNTAQTAVWFWENDNHSLTCPQGQIPDVYTDDCIQFECPIYQTAMSNLCLDRERDVTGLVITSTIHLQFHKPVYTGKTKDEIREFGRKVAKGIDDKMQVSRNSCEIRHTKMYANSARPSEGYIQEMLLVFKIANTEKCSVKQVVGIYAKLDTGKINVTVKLGETQKNPLHSSPLPGQYETFSAGLSFRPIESHVIETVLTEKPVSYEIRLPKKFHCPKILLASSKYIELVQKGYLESTENEILNFNNIKETKQVAICYSKYLDHWLSEMYKTKSRKRQNHLLLTDTLSMISTVTSMISLIIVLVTYSMFPELRFIPGKLLMVLCFNLLLAQGFYSFGLDLGINNIWCELVGVCIHMLWMATVFSMNSCLLLMSKNLKDPLESENRQFLHSKSNYVVFKYSFYSYGMSALCVLANVILSQLIYHDDHYGYGGKLCYINTRKMRIFTFALPIALVLIANFFMFACIMSSISQMMHMKYKAVVKAQIIIFLKLSTITGFYWSFGFIYEATDLKVFEHLFIVFNGGQGFFIMWSFLFNKRIMGMYKKACQNLCVKNDEVYTSDCTS